MCIKPVIKKGRVGILFPFSYLDSVPSIFNSVLSLVQHGYVVDIFMKTSPEYEIPDFSGYDVNIIITESEVRSQSPITTTHPKNGSQNDTLSHILYRLNGSTCLLATKCWKQACTLLSINQFKGHISIFKRQLRVLIRNYNNRYCCLIGVDPYGLREAYPLAKFIGIPLIYYSLELLLSNEANLPEMKKLKQKEVEFSKESIFIIIQDRERASLLSNDNQIPLDKFILVPNSPLGSARYNHCHYWHQLFDLSPNKKVVIHSGGIGNWTGIEEIIKSVNRWPEDWVLIIHTRYNREFSSEIDELRKISPPGRVFFSLTPVPRDKYDSLIDSADIGIAFYVPSNESTCTQQNIISIGLSSGKIAYYLHAGLPVIVNKESSINELVRQDKCGIVVESSKDIGNAIDQINQNYEEYSRNAMTAFDTYMDFTHGFQEVIQRVDALEEQDEDD